MSKGQENFEFIISVMVFLSVTSFITIQIINNISSMRRDLLTEDMRSTAFQISNIIILDGGYPNNWNSGNVERIGIADGFYSISQNKLNELKNICESDGGYKKFLSIIGTDVSKDIYLNISKLSGETLVLCAPEVDSSIRSRAEILRTSFLKGEGVIKIDVKVIL